MRVAAAPWAMYNEDAAMTNDSFAGFRPNALSFLRGLTRNNTREWFEGLPPQSSR
jgi:hypothetical protein